MLKFLIMHCTLKVKLCGRSNAKYFYLDLNMQNMFSFCGNF